MLHFVHLEIFSVTDMKNISLLHAKQYTDLSQVALINILSALVSEALKIVFTINMLVIYGQLCIEKVYTLKQFIYIAFPLINTYILSQGSSCF